MFVKPSKLKLMKPPSTQVAAHDVFSINLFLPLFLLIYRNCSQPLSRKVLRLSEMCNLNWIAKSLIIKWAMRK